jgi:hypothetical protein
MLAIWTQPDAIEINSVDNETSAFTLTVDADFVFSAGWVYSFEITAADGTTSISDGEGAYLTGDASGSFDDKLNDSYVPDIKNINLVVNYKWFINMPNATISRPVKITLVKSIYNQPGGGEFHLEYEHKIVNVILKDVVDITTS